MTTPRATAGGGAGTATSRRNVTTEANASNSSSNKAINGSAPSQKSPGAGGGLSRLPSIKEKERRTPSTSQLKKPRTSSLHDATTDSTTTTTTTALQRQESNSTTTSTSTTTTPRRPSLTQGAAQSLLAQKKPTFAGIGRRVSSMVRARMAFQTRRRSSSTNSASNGAESAEPNHMELIHEMPRMPRFTTYLSPEAQYAVMKGYEDMLYEKIASSDPESRLVLKRNKTPFHKKISIVDHQDGEGKAGNGCSTGGGGSPLGGGGTTATLTHLHTPAASSTTRSADLESVDENDNEDDANNNNNHPNTFSRKPMRALSTVSSDFSNGINNNRFSLRTTSRAGSEGPGSLGGSHGGGGGGGFPLHRSSSLPTLHAHAGLSHRRRLVLTYRLESAMDILDTLKRRNMENSLSPRVFRIPRQVDAVRDFNSWTKVWNKEFKVAHAK